MGTVRQLKQVLLHGVLAVVMLNLFGSQPSFDLESLSIPKSNDDLYTYDFVQGPAELVHKNQSDDIKNPFLPERIIVVVGLESSGTTMMQEVLAAALGAKKKEGFELVHREKSLRVQHISLPTGFFSRGDPEWQHRFEPLNVVPVFVPESCSILPTDVPTQHFRNIPARRDCRPLFGPNLIVRPPRFFLNVTSHVQFYQQRGVSVQTVVVIRDPSMHFNGILKGHCWNETAAYEQYQVGRTILKETIEALDPVVVSYETLMLLQMTYLEKIYKTLGIESTYQPDFRNGNIVHAKSSSYIAKRLQNET